MPLLALLTRIFLVRRLLGAGRRSRRGDRYVSRYPKTYGGRYASRYGGGFGRRRTGGGLRFLGPIPVYSRRTRTGGRVSVGGCCLPIPLALSVVAAGLGRLLLSRH